MSSPRIQSYFAPRWLYGIRFDPDLVQSFLQRAEQVGTYTPREAKHLDRGRALMLQPTYKRGGLSEDKEEALIGWGLDFLEILGVPRRPTWQGVCEGPLTHPPTDEELFEIVAFCEAHSKQEGVVKALDPYSLRCCGGLPSREVLQRISAMFGEPQWYMDHLDACAIREDHRRAQGKEQTDVDEESEDSDEESEDSDEESSSSSENGR